MSKMPFIVTPKLLSMLQRENVPLEFASAFSIPNGCISGWRIDYQGVLKCIASWHQKDASLASNGVYSFVNSQLPRLGEWDVAQLPVLRTYQRPAFASCVHGDRVHSGIVEAPPGWGKTILALHIMKTVGRHCMVVTTTKTLVKQWSRHLAKAGVSFQIFSDTKRVDINRAPTVILATYQAIVTSRCEESARDMLAMSAMIFGVLILDEVHVLPAQVYRSVGALLKNECQLKAMCKIGMTGTMMREDGLINDLEELVGPNLYRVKRQHMHVDAPVIIPTILRVPLHKQILQYHNTSNGFVKRLAALLNPAKLLVMRSVVQKHVDNKIILFVDFHLALNVVKEALPSVQIFGPVTGRVKADERERIIQNFRDASSGVLLTTDVLSLGMDVEDASVVIEMSADVSRSKCIQRWGRAWRAFAGKASAHCYTLVSRDTHEDEASIYRSSALHIKSTIVDIMEANAEDFILAYMPMIKDVCEQHAVKKAATKVPCNQIAKISKKRRRLISRRR